MDTNNEYLLSLVSDMRAAAEYKKNKKCILDKIKNQNTLLAKCIIARKYLSPQSTDVETICKIDLKINDPIDETSGDGHKNGNNYEIKSSIHGNESKLNFVQIRPDHNIDYYIFIAYNLHTNNATGQAYIFKVPSNVVCELIVLYGGYAHGTIGVLGQITNDNIKGRNCEYALRCNPNTKKGNSFELWKKLKEYEVEYNAENF
jgi:hypothetical protein